MDPGFSIGSTTGSTRGVAATALEEPRAGSAADGLAEAVLTALPGAQVDIADGEIPAIGDTAVDETVGALKFAESVPRPLLARLSRERFHPASEARVMRDVEIQIRFGD